jgi:DNA polymerase-3 subunit beta
VTDTRLTVTHTRGNTYIPVLPTEEYPIPPEQQYDNRMEIPAEWLMRALKGAAFAVASDGLRQQMTGINLKRTGSGVDVVATDGRALVVFHSDRVDDDTCSFGSSFPMPRKAADMVATLSHEDTIHVEWNDKHALVMAPDTELRFVLLEGTYPKYEAVIPTERKTLITVLRSQFITALRRVAPFCDRSSERAVITARDGVITISGEDDCRQSGAITTMVAEIDGGDVTVGVSASLLLAELQRIPSLEIKMYILDSNRPIVMRHEDDGESVVMLAMPMRVESD